MARSLTGIVTSDRSDKTIVVTITARKTHPLYKKQYTVGTKFMAHDEKNEAKVGDLVVITESRPVSARKRFALTRILERGGVRFESAIAVADIPEEQLTEEEKAPENVKQIRDKAAKEAAKEEEEKAEKQ